VIAQSSLGYINKIFANVMEVKGAELDALLHDLRAAGVIIPSGEGRSKGALSIACSEMAKMQGGKLILDRSDIGFPGRSLREAAEVLRRRYGYVTLLIVSGSGRSMMPLLDAQSLASYLAEHDEAKRYFMIDAITSDPESPIAKLASGYGNVLTLKGREVGDEPIEPSQFRSVGILEDVFTLGSSLLLQGVARALHEGAPSQRALEYVEKLGSEIVRTLEEAVRSEFFSQVLYKAEQRHVVFLGGLGSAQEVARMTAIRIGHVKRAVGDYVFVAGETSTPPPRVGDLLLVISRSGETEVVSSWCENFKQLGGYVAALVGRKESTIGSLADTAFEIPETAEPGAPSDFYLKAAFVLSPLPIYLVERMEQRGLRLPEYIIRWHHSVTA